MRRHQLLEVYITNLVKCRWVGPKGGKSPIVDHCTSRFLVREITLFAPQIVLFFGKAARRGADALLARLAPRCRSKQLLHPSYISNRCQVHRSTQEDCIRINDERIHEVLGRVTRPLQPPGAAGG
jgi:uracil-DNA glycosylase